MRRSRYLHFLCVLMLLPLFFIPAYADMGPKPSVTVTVEGLDGRECWGTLLSDRISTGPYSALEFGSDHTPWFEEDELEYPAWLAFQTYSDTEPDDYYFLQFVDDLSDGEFHWGYYPPDTFKIALWFPGEDALVVSEISEQYAFDSYYTVDLTEISLETGGVVTGLSATRSYGLANELAAFFVRAALTFGVELVIAILFVFRGAAFWKTLLAVNLVTQVLLNAVLNLYIYFSGLFIITLFLVYALAELAVVFVELFAYKQLLAGDETASWKKIAAYTWVANLASFALGMVLSVYVPVLF